MSIIFVPSSSANICLTLFGFTFGAINARRAYYYMLSGQALEESVNGSHIGLENLFMNNYDSMTLIEKANMEVLLRNLKTSQVLKPNKYFSLHKLSFVSTLAAITTYAIIMLQFKQAGFLFAKVAFVLLITVFVSSAIPNK